MSQSGSFATGGGGGGSVNGLVGNDSVVVGPNGSGDINVVGTGSITVAGNAGTNTETIELTGLTNHSVLVGAGTATITKVGPSATAGQIFQSGGSSTDPSYSTATYPSTATGTGTILRADGTNWSATTATYPNTTTANQLLYSSATNTIGGLATANNGVLITSSGGVPSISSTLPAAVQGNITSVGTITSGVWNGTAIGVTYGGTGLTSVSSGGTLYASASNTYSVLASPANVSNYGNPYSWNGSQPIWMDPLAYVYLKEDFMISSLTSGVFGFSSSTSGTGASTGIVGSAITNPGIWQVTTGTTTTGNATIVTNEDSYKVGGGVTVSNHYIKVPTSSNGTNTFSTILGFLGNALPSSANNNIYFSCDQNSSSDWFINCSNSASTTSVDSGVAVDNSAFHLFTIEINAASTSVTFYIDNVSVGTISADVPASGTFLQLNPIGIIKSAGTSSVSALIDFYSFYQALTTPR